MSEINLSKIPTEVINKAIRIIKDQGETPLSPGKKGKDGKVALCAAAAVASAGLELANYPERKRKFESAIVTTSSSDAIREVFGELGWPVDVCNRMVVMNDSFPEHERSRSVISYFETSA